MPEETSEHTTHSRFRRPPWLKVRMKLGEEFYAVDSILKKLRLNTVCREAACPNIGTCFNDRTATFLILGHVCTRNCRFCNVTYGTPSSLDGTEPERIAQAVKELGLDHVVITSVTRDDLPDGGSSVFADTIKAMRRASPAVTVEVLVPDFQGCQKALKTVVDAAPDVVGHNVETVPRLYGNVRSQADYERSLSVLKAAKELGGGVTKSGIMVGLGETKAEVYAVLDDLAASLCDIVTIGQYLAPTGAHSAVQEYYTPHDFKTFTHEGLKKGFSWVESGPLVRSSFHAKKQWQRLLTEDYG